MSKKLGKKKKQNQSTRLITKVFITKAVGFDDLD